MHKDICKCSSICGIQQKFRKFGFPIIPIYYFFPNQEFNAIKNLVSENSK
jgi:hypothetical protein